MSYDHVKLQSAPQWTTEPITYLRIQNLLVFLIDVQLASLLERHICQKPVDFVSEKVDNPMMKIFLIALTAYARSIHSDFKLTTPATQNLTASCQLSATNGRGGASTRGKI